MTLNFVTLKKGGKIILHSGKYNTHPFWHDPQYTQQKQL
jgi:hypothetical protein